MVTFSRAAALREILFGWRVVSVAGASVLCVSSFALGLAAGPVLP